MKFVILDQEEFQTFAKSQKNYNFWQSIQMGNYKKKQQYAITYVGVKKEETILCAMMLSKWNVGFGYCMMYANRGPYINYKEKALVTFFFKELKQYMKQQRCIYFKMDPYLLYCERDMDGNVVENGECNEQVIHWLADFGYRHLGVDYGMCTDKEPNWMFVKYLQYENEKELFDSFDSQTKRKVKRIKKLNINIRQLTRKELPIFYAVMQHTSSRRGFQESNVQYYEQFYDSFDAKDELKFMVAELQMDVFSNSLNKDIEKNRNAIEKLMNQEERTLKQEEKLKKLQEEEQVLQEKYQECQRMMAEAKDNVLVLAAGAFLCVGNEVIYLYGGGYQQYAKYSPMYGLQWEMLTQALHMKKARYNFYGISGVFDKKDHGYGVYEFKKGFHGVVEQLIGEFECIVHPKVYNLYNTLSKIKNFVKKS